MPVETNNQERCMVMEFELASGDFDRAGEASSKIKRNLQQLGLKPDVIRRLAVICYEAEMNVIIHAYRGKLRARICPTYTEVVVDDEGPGIRDLELAMHEGYSTAPDYIREMGFGAGMGLPNIKKCADELVIKSEVGKGTRLEAIVRY